MTLMNNSEFRRLPSVDRLMSDDRLIQLAGVYSHSLVLGLVRRQLEQARLDIVSGKPCPTLDEIIASVDIEARTLGEPGLRPLINASGVILHTNLGRAPLSKEAIAAVNEAAAGYCNLEFDLAGGTRGSRNSHLEGILCQLTGAEAALVVNNNASALLLALTALVRRKEVIVSRGQAVEIGGGFRIPDVMRQSGVKLVDVGTTNYTRVSDYEQAITPRTGALMRVHSSNFKLIGFTYYVALDEMVAVGNRHDLPVFDDVGSGCLLDTARFGLAPEPTVQESIAAGVSLVFFSGDKLLGGPQAGIIAGKKDYIDRLKKHPLVRAIRIDKLNLAALGATLLHYLKDEALEKVPVWRMISTPLSDIERRAGTWAQALGEPAEVVDGETMVGGGSLPGGTLPTKLVAINDDKRGKKAQALGQWLRSQETPVVGRISDKALLLDPRSVLPEEDEKLLKVLHDLSSHLAAGPGS